MANIKGKLRPEGANNYADVIHLETTASQVIEETNKRFMTDAERAKLANANVTSVAGKTGAVTLVKGDVGLGSVQNYAIATQAEAQAGTSNVKYMTPLRTAEAINKLSGKWELLNTIQLSTNANKIVLTLPVGYSEYKILFENFKSISRQLYLYTHFDAIQSGYHTISFDRNAVATKNTNNSYIMHNIGVVYSMSPSSGYMDIYVTSTSAPLVTGYIANNDFESFFYSRRLDTVITVPSSITFTAEDDMFASGSKIKLLGR